MVRQTVPDGYYPVSEVEFSQVIVTVMLNQFIFITSSPINLLIVPQSQNEKYMHDHICLLQS